MESARQWLIRTIVETCSPQINCNTIYVCAQKVVATIVICGRLKPVYTHWVWIRRWFREGSCMPIFLPRKCWWMSKASYKQELYVVKLIVVFCSSWLLFFTGELPVGAACGKCFTTFVLPAVQLSGETTAPVYGSPTLQSSACFCQGEYI